jgi:endonuclease/exonuclease/phosphatase family metal-dependent hydrolase
MNIQVITWNVGKANLKQFSWTKELVKWNIIKPTSNIIFLTLQECDRDLAHNQFLHALHKILPNHNVYWTSHGSLKFHVAGFVCIEKNIQIDKYNTKQIDCKSQLINTKPSIAKNITIKTSSSKKNLLFIGCHLPVQTKTPDLGYEERITSVQKIKEKIIKPVEPLDLIIWAGDLNFRISDLTLTDQLSQVLDNKLCLLGYQEPPITFQPTCKYIEFKPDNDISLSSFITRRHNCHGYNTKRRPSYCDRIIYYHTNTIKLIVDKYQHISPLDYTNYPLSIALSDHVPVILEGQIHQISPTCAVADVRSDIPI